MDITFPGYQHVFGLPERATNFSLQPTAGACACVDNDLSMTMQVEDQMIMCVRVCVDWGITCVRYGVLCCDIPCCHFTHHCGVCVCVVINIPPLLLWLLQQVLVCSLSRIACTTLMCLSMSTTHPLACMEPSLSCWHTRLDSQWEPFGEKFVCCV